MKKFSNYYQEMKRKHGVCGNKSSVNEQKPMKLFEETTGRQLFEERHEEINREAAHRRMTSPSTNHAGIYQTVLKEMWESLDDDQQMQYNNAAEDHSESVPGRVPSSMLITM